jgi:hypothetical protein
MQGDAERPPSWLERELINPARSWRAQFSTEAGDGGGEWQRPKSVEKLEFERRGGFLHMRREAAIRFFSRVLWCGCALPEAIMIIVIPAFALSTTQDGFRFYQTLNFTWACSTLTDIYLTSQLTACYLRCIVVSARHLEPTGSAALRHDPRSHVPSAKAIALAVEKATCPSRLDRVLAFFYMLLGLETTTLAIVGTLHTQELVGKPFESRSGWSRFSRVPSSCSSCWCTPASSARCASASFDARRRSAWST